MSRECHVFNLSAVNERVNFHSSLHARRQKKEKLLAVGGGLRKRTIFDNPPSDTRGPYSAFITLGHFAIQMRVDQPLLLSTLSRV